MNDVQNGLRRWRRFRGRLVGCVSLFLMFVVECCGSRVALGAAPGESFIAVRNPRALPPRISAVRIPLGITGDYKPSLALLPDGELLLVMFHGVDQGGGKTREDMIHYRSADGGKTWGERQVLPLLGREPYFSVLRDGTLFITTHLLPQDVRNTESYIHSYVHRSADGGKTWSTLKIGAEDVPGVTEKSWTHTSRNVLELQDGTLILGVSAGRVRDRKTGRFCFDFKSDRLVLDEKTPTDKPSGGGFGNTVQLPGGQLVSAYTYRGEDGNVHAEVLRWALPQPANSLTRPPKPGKP